MTRTEERLADALTASYDAAQALPLRPLSLDPPRPRRWVLLFAPVAAALAVVAVIVGLNVLSGRMAGPPRPVVPPAGHSKSAPRYYVDVNYHGQAVVRSVATGQVTGTVPLKFSDADGAAAPTSVHGLFYIAGVTGDAAKIYRFRLTGAGQVTGFAAVPGAPTFQDSISAMVVSPDGTKLAVAVSPAGGMTNTASITVFPLSGGGPARTWSGGLARKGYQAWDVTDLSWPGGDKQLAFSALWCQHQMGNAQVCVSAAHGTRHYSQLRELDVAKPGSSLGRSRALLDQDKDFPYIAAAVLKTQNDISFATVVSLSGPVRYSSPGTVPGHLTVSSIGILHRVSGASPRTKSSTASPVEHGTVLPDMSNLLSGTGYQRATGPTSGWLLSPDGNGRYLLSGAAVYNGGDGPPKLQNKGFNGEIGYGWKFTNLPPSSGELTGQAW